jgi:hypothetical protein
VNQRRDCVSPVVASMSCSPHPAALHIAPAARLLDFASMILRAENSFTKVTAICFNCQRSKKTNVKTTENKNLRLRLLSSRNW